MLTKEQEQNVIDTDMFGDDFSAPGDRLLSDKFVTGRKAYTCCWCKGGIAIGERHRSASAAMDGELSSIRYCAECCQAMSDDYDEDDCEHLESRMGLHCPETQARNAELKAFVAAAQSAKPPHIEG